MPVDEGRKMVKKLLCCEEVDSGRPLSTGSGRVRGHLITSQDELKKQDLLSRGMYVIVMTLSLLLSLPCARYI